MVPVCALCHSSWFVCFQFLFLGGWIESGTQAGQVEACSVAEVLADTFSSCLVKEGDKIQAALTYPLPPCPFRDSITGSGFLTNTPAQF